MSFTRLLACAAVSAVVLLGPAVAGERIFFKNGHVLEVLESRAEGDSVVLKLRDGGELAVPKSLIERTEGGRDVQGKPSGTAANAVGPGARSPRSTPATELRGFRAAASAVPGNNTMTMAGVATGGNDGKGARTYGFSQRGSGDLALTPIEPARQVHMQDIVKRRRAEAPEAAQPAAPGTPAPEANVEKPMLGRPESSGQRSNGPA